MAVPIEQPGDWTVCHERAEMFLRRREAEGTQTWKTPQERHMYFVIALSIAERKAGIVPQYPPLPEEDETF